MSSAEQRERFARWLDGGLDPGEEAELRHALRADSGLLAACRAEARCAAWLATVHGAERAAPTAEAVLRQLGTGTQSARHRQADAVLRCLPRRRARWPWLALAATLAAAVALWLLTGDGTASGPASLPVTGGGSIALAPGASARREAGVWRLEAGSAEIVCDHRPAGSPPEVVVRTPEAELAVHGTAFAVERSPGQTIVSVRDGTVAVRGAGGTLLLPLGGRAVATADAILGSLAWRSGDPRPPWLAIGTPAADGLVAERFPDGFATRGVDLRPLRLGLGASASVKLRAHLSGGAPSLELWFRDRDGTAWIWEEFTPPQDVWLERSVPLSAFRDDAKRSRPPPPGTVLDWLHVATRDGAGRSLVIGSLELRGLLPGGE